MACSKYQYVKKFQQKTVALLQTYIVVRIDGRGFTKFCNAHNFNKPNDLRAIKLMNAAAEYVCNKFTEIFLAYGQSDEYSFIFNKNTTLFGRRTDKILSCMVSAFTAAYICNWPKYFDDQMKEIPSFDGRVVLYPNDNCMKDYFKWRQVDCHINNLYNTTFWQMVRKGKSNQEVEKILKDTNSGQKNEILFSQFGINYNTIEQIYRRGTLLYYVEESIKEQSSVELKQPETKPEQQIKQSKSKKEKMKGGEKIRRKLIFSHEDIIKQEFWNRFFE